MKKSKIIRVRFDTYENLKKKQRRLQEVVGKRIPTTKIIHDLSKQKLWYSDEDLVKIKKWRKNLV